MRNIIILLLISANLFSQVTIVHSKKDPRLLAYKDSMECYLHGLRELRVAKNIKNRQDTAEGRKAYDFVTKFYEKLNENIKSVSDSKLYVAYKITNEGYYIVTHRWFPEVWKKPVHRVIYEPIKQIVKADTIKTSKHIFVYTLNGQAVSREQFEKVYGRKTKTEN